MSSINLARIEEERCFWTSEAQVCDVIVYLICYVVFWFCWRHGRESMNTFS